MLRAGNASLGAADEFDGVVWRGEYPHQGGLEPEHLVADLGDHDLRTAFLLGSKRLTIVVGRRRRARPSQLVDRHLLRVHDEASHDALQRLPVDVDVQVVGRRHAARLRRIWVLIRDFFLPRARDGSGRHDLLREFIAFRHLGLQYRW